MNRRFMLQVCAGVLALGFGVRAVAQVPGWKICQKEGHQMGSKTYSTDYPVNGYPLCTKTLYSTKCPRCNSDWTYKVEMSGECPKPGKEAC